jgi:hypothetical protein
MVGGAPMQTKEGDVFKSVLDGVEYAIKKIVHRNVLLESKDGKRQILTEVDNLKLTSFYQKLSEIGMERDLEITTSGRNKPGVIQALFGE